MSNAATIFMILLMLLVLGIYCFKWALHFQYLRVQNKKSPGHWSDYFKKSFSNKKDAQWWKEAIMLFPLFHPIVLTGNDKEDFWLAKIKRTNLGLYFLLIVLLLAGIYFSKVGELPQ